MAQVELVETEHYTQNVQDMGFALATGILMVLVLVIFASMMYRFITSTVMNKLKDIRADIKELREDNETICKGMCIELVALKDKLQPISTWVSIDMKRKLNGSYEKIKGEHSVDKTEN